MRSAALRRNRALNGALGTASREQDGSRSVPGSAAILNTNTLRKRGEGLAGLLAQFIAAEVRSPDERATIMLAVYE